jgi:phosphoribosylformimino-5-aminoimidazole carboxamide ribotide isomerase
MQIIPVIDLKDGIVVHAKQGNRDDYEPIHSGICKSANIFDVIDVFWTKYRFETTYIADLNAITRSGSNSELLADVLATYPNITFWVDIGYPITNEDFLCRKNFIPVLGSESFHDGNIVGIEKFNKNFILSLDYSINGPIGAPGLFSKQQMWPDNIIIMSLPNVGSNQGPDIDKLMAYRQQYPQYNIIAAGGTRGIGDLKELKRIGIRQALVATALHNCKITPWDIANC